MEVVMRILLTTLFLFPVFLLPGMAHSAELSGSLLYDDLPLSQTFTDITTVQIDAYPWGGGDPVQGTIDLAGDSYSFSGLDAVHYSIMIYLDRTAPASQVGNWGDLTGVIDLTVDNSSDSLDIDCDIRYIFRVLSPIDSAVPLNGSGLDCTTYPTAIYPITFAIEEVPRATSYESVVYLSLCPTDYVDAITTQSTDPSTEVDWGSAGEDFHELSYRCVGISGKPLCQVPVVRYDDTGVWALYLRDGQSAGRTTHHHDAVVIPATAEAPGAGGTYWSSAVSITNLEARDRQLEITYTPRGTNGMTSYTSTSVSLPTLSQLSWSNILSDLFSTTGAGALEIRGTSLAVTSRTSTPDGEGGSYGQGIPPIQPDQILSSSQNSTATIGGVEQGATFRTNLGLCEVWGETASVTVEVFDDSMNQLGSETYDLRPYENIQVNRVVPEVCGINVLTDGIVRVTVTSGDGRIGAYISIIDNSSDDPTYITVAPQSTIGGS